MREMLDWNDLRYFLAVARDGSTLAAARELRVSQTTVARRIAANGQGPVAIVPMKHEVPGVRLESSVKTH